MGTGRRGLERESSCKMMDSKIIFNCGNSPLLLDSLSSPLIFSSGLCGQESSEPWKRTGTGRRQMSTLVPFPHCLTGDMGPVVWGGGAKHSPLPDFCPVLFPSMFNIFNGKNLPRMSNG